jgi:hypothetical protein
MIFFLAHYFVSPMMNPKSMEKKATVKLIISLVFSLLLAFAPIVTPPGTKSEVVKGVLQIEFAIDTVLFFLLSKVFGSTPTKTAPLGGTQKYEISSKDIKRHAAAKKAGGGKPPIAKKTGSTKKNKAA